MRSKNLEKSKMVNQRERAENVLRANEECLHALIENSPVVNAIINADGTIRYESKPVERILGYKREERVGKHILDLVHPEDKSNAATALAQLMQEPGGSMVRRVRIQHADGSWHNIEVIAKNLIHDPAVSGIVASLRDVTDLAWSERAHQEAELRYLTLTEKVGFGVFVIQDDVVKFANQGVREIIGYSDEEIVGQCVRDLFDLVAIEAKDLATDRYEALREGKEATSFRNEYRIVRKDGGIVEIEGSSAQVSWEGKPAMMGIFCDITERKRTQDELNQHRYRLKELVEKRTAELGTSNEQLLQKIAQLEQIEEALRESEENFKALAENSLDAITVLVDEGVRVYANKRAAEITGYSVTELLNSTLKDLVHPGELEAITKRYKKRMDGKPVPSHYETVFRRKNGESILIELSATRTIWHGKPAVMSTFHDITEHKQAEEALQESEARYRALFEASADGIVIANSETREFKYVNPAICKMLGYNEAELTGMGLADIHPKDSLAHVVSEFEAQSRGEKTLAEEIPCLRKDGTIVYADISTTTASIDGEVCAIGLFRDITERKKAEEALREREEYFRALIENSLDVIVILNRDGAIRYQSPSLERVLGYSSEELLTRTWFEFVDLEDVQKATSDFNKLQQNKGGIVRTELRAQHKDGSWRTIEAIGCNLLDDHAVAGIVANFRDITDRKQVEKALRESEHNYRTLFESTIEGAVVIDAETMKVVLANQTAAKMYGFDSMQEVTEANLLDYVHPEDRERAVRAIAEDLFEKDLRRIEEFRTLTKDGREIRISGVGTRIEYQGRLAGLISFRDITEHRKSEEKLQQLYEQERDLRQQLEAEMKKRIEFTRGLAHELKTPLTSVLASCDLLISEVSDEPWLSFAENISRGAHNLNGTIDELLDLARGEIGMLQLKLEKVDPTQLLREIVNSMTPLALKREQSLVLDLSPSLPQVQVDVARLQQVVTNLLSNATKFTPMGGNITLRAAQKDAALVIEVQDTGRGMSRQEQKQLFEPYHRLVRDGERLSGLGLGLSLCKTLVELHGGQIWAKSRAGKGSTFGFSLPIEAAGERPADVDKEGKLWKVLIIEDDEAIIDSVSLAFQIRWPEAYLVSTGLGEEGVELVETEAPDIVILDLGLPDMDGYDILKEIRLFSSVPIIILTVRANEADMVKGLEWGADDYLVKPFRQLELLARLKAQLRKQIPPDEEAPIVWGPLRLDPSTYQLTYNGREISLTIIEGRVIQCLMKNGGHVVTHSRLAEAVWGEDYTGSLDSIRVYIRYLREKLEADPSNPELILTKAGIGYSLTKPV